MSAWWRARSVRFRLTVWYAAALAVVMLAYGGFVYAALRETLQRELDHQFHEDTEAASDVMDRARDGTADWQQEFARLWPEDEGYERRIEIRRRDGELLYESAPPESMRDAVNGGLHTQALEGEWAGVTFFRSATRMRHELNQVLLVLGLGLPFGVGLAAVGGYALARRALAPVGEMADRARTISASNLSARLPVENAADEFGQLASVFNATLARLESSFEQLRRFTADASHELRTPLTAIRAVGEVGLQEPRTPEEYREIVGSMLEEVDRLAQLVESLLTLSRADAGKVALHRESVDLADLVRDVATHLGVLAEEKAQTITVDAPASFLVSADRTVLRLALVNLVDNAVKYAPSGTVVSVAVRQRDGTATVAVTDAGPGIAREHLPRIFDRFYRVDAARSRAAGGAGLGLAIARWAVEAHGGTIEVESEPARGSTFRVILPVATQ